MIIEEEFTTMRMSDETIDALVWIGPREMVQRAQGRAIVNVSSINYRLGIAGRSIYATTKAGGVFCRRGCGKASRHAGPGVGAAAPYPADGYRQPYSVLSEYGQPRLYRP